ncbi:hypothetical protein [Streptomyces anulatus]
MIAAQSRPTTTGHVTLRFQHGRIAESWFNDDAAGALEQVGVLLRPPCP